MDTVRISEQVEIPADEFRFRFSRSGGPGGQHVNRSATQVELLFDVAGSPSLTDEQRTRVISRLRRYLDSEGTLHLVSSSRRSQYRNRQEVLARFAHLMERALRPPKTRRRTRPTAASRERRLAEKRRRGEIKRLRRGGNGE